MVTTAHRHRITNIAAARDAVPNLLDALRGFATRIHPITEREYLSRVLDFTTWDGSDSARLALLKQRLLVGGDLTDRRGKAIASQGDAVESKATLESAEFLRDMFRRHLAERLDGITRWDYGRHIYLNMLVLPSQLEDASSRSVFLPRDVAAAIHFALALLYDRHRSHGDDLRKCELATCGGYFLLDRNPKGGKPKKYHDACRARLRAKSRHLKRNSEES